jgi:hypothetical protein
MNEQTKFEGHQIVSTNLQHYPAMILLDKGFMCRGYITRGKIYHTNEHLIGSGYHRGV